MGLNNVVFNYNSMKALTDGDGATLDNTRHYLNYDTGYSVATTNYTYTTARAAYRAVLEMCYDGKGVGVWYSNGIYYIDESKYILDYEEANRIGVECNQQQIFDWSTKECLDVIY